MGNAASLADKRDLQLQRVRACYDTLLEVDLIALGDAEQNGPATAQGRGPLPELLFHGAAARAGGLSGCATCATDDFQKRLAIARKLCRTDTRNPT